MSLSICYYMQIMCGAAYHRIGHDVQAIERLLVDIFLESHSTPPRQIVFDLDVTDDLLHGNQEQAFFNTYYGGYCYAPLYIFCGKHLLVAKLRPSNVDRRHRLDFKIQAERGGFAQPRAH